MSKTNVSFKCLMSTFVLAGSRHVTGNGTSLMQLTVPKLSKVQCTFNISSRSNTGMNLQTNFTGYEYV